MRLFNPRPRPERPEWLTSETLEKQINEARRQMGERRWHRLMEEWREAKR